MNLSKKTLLYSTVISMIIVSLIVGYFILMLPSLYVDYMQERNYDSIVALQKGYMKGGNYDNLEVINPTGTVTVEIPFTGDSFFIAGKFFRITIDLQDKELKVLLAKIRYYAKHTDEIDDISKDKFDFSMLQEKLFLNQKLWENYPMKFKFESKKNGGVFKETSSKLHVLSDDLVIYETNVSDGQNYYTTYVAMGTTENEIIISSLPLMTPRIEEIKPVILQSLPMIMAVAFLLVLVSSQVFSKLIVKPIIRLTNHAAYVKETKNFDIEPLAVTGHDEISILGENLNELYQRLQENYNDQEVKNQYLTEEYKRQEVFLRASSHQLKTPITAALLLVQGMLNEVGKYKNVKEYLPQVKIQLQSMQKIVEDILYLNHCSNNIDMESYSLEQMVTECMSSYRVQIEEKSLRIIKEGQMTQVETDSELMKKVLDNLLSNAINYTPEGNKIQIVFEKNKLCIKNYGVTIDAELLPHIFEPFVTSNNRNKGHGLGLYVVAYYAQFLGCQVKIHNFDGGVKTELIFT